MVVHQSPTVTNAIVYVLLDSLEQTARPLSIHVLTLFARMVVLFYKITVNAHANAKQVIRDQTARFITHVLSTLARTEVHHKS